MANIFEGTSPPAWLTHMTAQEPGMLGKIVGELVGGLATSAEVAIDKASTKQNQGIDTSWIKELPGSIQPGFFEARMNLQNPLWKMQAQQAQLNMAQQAIGIKSQQSAIESRATKLRMQEHDQEVLPKWLQDHPTWESRQEAPPPSLFTSEAMKMLRDVQLGDAGNIKHKAIVEGISSFAKSVSDLQKVDPVAAAPFATEIGKVPTPETQARLGAALEAAKVKMQPIPMEIPLPNGKTMVGVYDQKTGKFIESKDANKVEEIKARSAEKQADEQRKAEISVATDKVKQLFRAMHDVSNQRPAVQTVLKKEYDDARKELQTLTSAPAGQASSVAPAPAPANEVIRVTKDGKKAVFDADTKKFIRYAE